ncbi:MAG TPA: endonuclease/exonuclease/phosphatase family protein, partial [Longimicrobiales bacterium]|nr:endonuclease/exonuclease/phosphatase family protein [Longimicrobiales bacterium]
MAVAAAATLLAAGCGGAGTAPGVPGDGGGEGPAAASIVEVQGAGHLSPLAGRRVVVTGVVTAVGEEGFYLQDPAGDGDPATSEGVFVATPGASGRSVGDRVEVTGTVREHVPGGTDTENLSVTRIEASGLELLEEGAALPGPVVLGSGGRIPPQVEVIGDEELPVDLRDPDEAAANEFDPDEEGIDFYESLEGMRVRVPGPVAVSPLERFGERDAELWVLSEGGAHVTPAGARTFRGGILLQPHPENRGGQNPERIQLQYDPAVTGAAAPSLAVGSELGDASGVVSYAFGNYEVVLTAAPEAEPAAYGDETTELEGTSQAITVASYNVLNLNPLPETADRVARIAEHVAGRLRAPDVVALQEIQDEGGTEGGEEDTTTDASGTLRALVDAIEAAGGPRYRAFDVAPAPNSSGGVPGGNIRNAFLYDPGRVELVGHRALTPEALRDVGARDPEAFQGSRDPLAARFVFGGDTITVINNHLTSRFGSTPIFGAVHPFEQAGEEARAAQARALHDVVAARLAEDPDAAVVVLGDMNTFQWTDDLDRLLPGEGDPILYDLLLDVPADERYSYLFEGNSQAL